MLLEIFCVTIHLKNTFTRTLHFEANTTTHRLATNPWLQFFLTVLSHQRDLQARRYRKHPSLTTVSAVRTRTTILTLRSRCSRAFEQTQK